MMPDAPLHHIDKRDEFARLGPAAGQSDSERGKRGLEAVSEVGDVAARALQGSGVLGQ